MADGWGDSAARHSLVPALRRRRVGPGFRSHSGRRAHCGRLRQPLVPGRCGHSRGTDHRNRRTCRPQRPADHSGARTGGVPGFIDMMGATSEPLLENRASAQSKLRQGITTILAGEGGSVAPSARWLRFRDYYPALERAGIPINVVHNVGAAQVRQMVIGDQNRAPTPEQLARMKDLVEQAMRDGAVGLSSALIYPLGTYATTEELIELAKVAGKYGGVYFTHMRNESSQVLDSIREAIRIGEEGGLPVHIFHLKAEGEQNWPLMTQAIALIQSARDRGLDVTADIYPYIRNGI